MYNGQSPNVLGNVTGDRERVCPEREPVRMALPLDIRPGYTTGVGPLPETAGHLGERLQDRNIPWQ